MQANKIIIKEDEHSLKLVYKHDNVLMSVWNYFKNSKGTTDFTNLLDLAGRLQYAQENNIEIIREF